MKKLFTLLLLSIAFCGIVSAQGNWNLKSNFGGTARHGAVGFSIGNKGYIGTGNDDSTSSFNFKQDFWEWDPSTNVWTQKANFGGTARQYAIGFSIGAKGYIGTGNDNNNANTDTFWEWDQATNTWSQKANISGGLRKNAVAFSIGNRGYVGTGYDGANKQDFWEYDPAANYWSQKANFNGGIRQGATGFSIGSKGYIGTGSNGSTYYNDFWEYDLAANIWTQKANFGGTGRNGSVGFSIGEKGYIGTGSQFPTYNKDFWEWDQATNTWTQKANFGGVARNIAVGFSIGIKGYIGTGYGGTNKQDFWEWDSYLLTLSASSTNISCNGNNDGIASVTVTGGVFPYTYNWSNSATTNSIFGLSPGIYTVTVADSSGYTLSAAANVTQPQALSISHNASNSSCGGNAGSANITVNGGTTPYSFLWSNGSTTQNIYGIGGGTYSVVVTDNNGCTISDAVIIINSVPPDSIPICMVTVDSTSNKNLIVWEKPVSNNIDSFRIFRDIASIYTHIGSVAYNSFSVFADTTNGINPSLTSYRYKISVKDTCGIESVLSAYHKTIHLQVSPASPIGYNLNWDDYIGMSVTQYRILFDSTKSGNWQVIDSVPFGITSYTDPTVYPDTIAYMIEVIHPVGCSPTLKDNPQVLTSSFISTRSNWNKIFLNSVAELSNNIRFTISPNPFSAQTTLQTDNPFHNATLSVDNCFGQTVKQIKNISGQTVTLARDNLPSGLYFVRLTEENKTIAVDKLVITDK